MENSTIWTEIQDYMKSNTTPTAYHLWISAIELAYLDDTSAKLKVPKELNLNVIKSNYINLFNNAFEIALGHKIAIELICNDISMENNMISKPEEFTFDNFVVDVSNRLAYIAASNLVATIISKCNFANPLLIYGDKESGKTHLLNAIRNEIKNKMPNLQIAFVDENNSIDEISTNADVLLVDDVQLFMNDEFFNIYNSFIDSNKQVVLTADKIYSQFDCGLMADIAPVDFETKIETEESEKQSSSQETNKSKKTENKFLKTLGKIAGSAALKVAEGAIYAVEETSAAVGSLTNEIIGNDLGFVTEKIFDLRSKSSEKVAELWDKEPKELTMATGEKINGFIESAISSALSNVSDYERNINEYERKVNQYENSSSNPDYDKINEAREKISSARDNSASVKEQLNTLKDHFE